MGYLFLICWPPWCRGRPKHYRLLLLLLVALQDLTVKPYCRSVSSWRERRESTRLIGDSMMHSATFSWGPRLFLFTIWILGHKNPPMPTRSLHSYLVAFTVLEGFMHATWGWNMLCKTCQRNPSGRGKLYKWKATGSKGSGKHRVCWTHRHKSPFCFFFFFPPQHLLYTRHSANCFANDSSSHETFEIELTVSLFQWWINW